MRRRECLKLIGSVAVSSLLKANGTTIPLGTKRSSSSPEFGVSSITLGSLGQEHAVALPCFLRAGGFPDVTPTCALVWWDAKFLHVDFSNTERNQRYRGNPGLAKAVNFPGNGRFDLSAYPDAVYVQYRPDWTVEK